MGWGTSGSGPVQWDVGVHSWPISDFWGQLPLVQLLGRGLIKSGL